ncbi:hypothetical protein PanWU01x14_270650 [Parasponia andersonii]|uniref:Uncharacterized protein n=1 Tax=Parasponia andersonii TaxID=3476 RepID=A0A2P5B514_PARAD|nr:hypothetical protein PanWU01x14_270650 [Parasponia andersonii]
MRAINARDVTDSNSRTIQLYGHWLKGVSQTISCFVPNLQHSNLPVGNKEDLTTRSATKQQFPRAANAMLQQNDSSATKGYPPLYVEATERFVSTSNVVNDIPLSPAVQDTHAAHSLLSGSWLQTLLRQPSR